MFSRNLFPYASLVEDTKELTTREFTLFSFSWFTDFLFSSNLSFETASVNTDLVFQNE